LEYLIKNKKILITGGAGFIGSNLCEYFLKCNQVVCLDNFSTGFKTNIEAFLGNPNFTLIEGDIRDLSVCEKAVQNVDYVLHQAALGSVPRSIEDPITSNEVNVSGFLNILQSAKGANIKRFVYAASSSTYGDSEQLPKIEDVIGKPLSPYAVTKYVNELYANVFFKTYGLETIGLRYFNVFGKNQTPEGAYAAVIPKFIKQLINHQSPIVNGDGNFSRDFTFIENVIQMNELALYTEETGAINQVFNTAFGERTTLNELIKQIKNALLQFDEDIVNVPIIYKENRIGDIPHSLASIDKAREILGYNPKYSLEQGLKKAIEWYWENLKNKK
jgi:UDP-N-acetylglucosamine/UDP-N-acetylgalactosamine 4-epimerase